MDPGRIDETECFAAKVQSLSVGHGPDLGGVDPQMVGEHRLGRLRGQDNGSRIAGQEPGDAPRMVLLRVVGDDIVDPVHILEIALEHMDLGRLHRVDESDLVPAADEIGIVARAVGQGDEAVEQPAVKVRGANVQDVGNDLSGFHAVPSPRNN